MYRKPLIAIGIAAATTLALTSCIGTSGTSEDQKTINSTLKQYEANQPIPRSDYSEYRQTVIDVEQAQIHGVATTTFFYNQGVQQPFKSCPSIGFPVSTTSQLTNPSQISYGGQTDGANGDYGVIDQSEPNGVYTGDSSGTYVVCVTPAGTKYITYWEGFVDTEGGAAHYDSSTHMIVLDSATVKSTGKAPTK